MLNIMSPQAPSKIILGKITHVFFKKPQTPLTQKLEVLICQMAGGKVEYVKEGSPNNVSYDEELVKTAEANGEIVSIAPLDYNTLQNTKKWLYVNSSGKILLARTKCPTIDKNRKTIGTMPEGDGSLEPTLC